MKNNLLIIFLFFSSTCFAQIFEGTPVNFCTLFRDTYNPGVHNGTNSNMWVTIRSDRDWSPTEKLFLQRDFWNDHPDYIILDDPTVS